MELMQAVEAFVLGLAGSPWILLAVAVLATIDGFFPPVPSESIVIAVAALAASGDAPSLWLLVLAAALGAFSGDLIAYTIGSKLPVENLRGLRGPRGQAALARAKRALAKRGTVYILSARFIPIGRVAVNMTAGAVGFPRRRFVGIAAVAAVVWGGYSTLMGLGAGEIFHEQPLIAVAVGVAGGVVAGIVVDKILGVAQRRWFPDVPPPAVRMHVEEDDDVEAASERHAAGEQDATSGSGAGEQDAVSERGAAEQDAVSERGAAEQDAVSEQDPVSERAAATEQRQAHDAPEPTVPEGERGDAGARTDNVTENGAALNGHPAGRPASGQPAARPAGGQPAGDPLGLRRIGSDPAV